MFIMFTYTLWSLRMVALYDNYIANAIFICRSKM